jgi:hypothetical protein
MSATEIKVSCNFMSPAALPENSLDWESLVSGAELLVYVKAEGGTPVGPEPEKPKRSMSIGDEEHTIEMPRWSSDPEQAEFDRFAEAAVDQSNLRGAGWAQWLMKTGARVVPAVLGRQPYSDDAWRDVVRPFLARHAGEEHKATMLELLELDPRMGDGFLDKGWNDDALPVCRRQLLEGRLPPARCVLALAKLKDPKLAAALQREFPRVEGKIPEISEALKSHPGVEWEEAVAEGWRRRKYGVGFREGERYFANWAAQLGDGSALDRLAMEAARGKKWQQERLDKLFASLKPPTVGVLPWLREHRSNLRFDEGSASWTLDG